MNFIKSLGAKTMALAAGLPNLLLTDPNVPSQLNDLIGKMDTVKTIVITMIGTAGVIYLAFSIWTWSEGMKNGDDNKSDKGIKGMFASFVMIAIDAVIAIFV